MVKSIKYFEEKCINKFEELENKFLKDPTRIAEYVLGLTSELQNLGLQMVAESLETMDEMLRESPVRKRNWQVEGRSEKRLITSLGTVSFRKTLFTDKRTGKSEYLLDRIMGMGRHERMTEDAEARLLEEVVQTSYRRGGEGSSLGGGVSRQTVKNKLHGLEFPSWEKGVGRKREVEYLYIDADEDHVSLQFLEKKGDLGGSGKGVKSNCQIVKLVYVYEGTEEESPGGGRRRLVNPHCFCRVCEGEGNRELWDEVYEYMDGNYDLKKVKKVYVNGDGGSWILSGVRRLSGLTHVLDGFHLEKALTRLTSHMLDSREDAKEELRRAIRDGGKVAFEGKVRELEGYLKEGAGEERMEKAREYVLSNWEAARMRLGREEGVSGCSAEGHVSHVLSSRMSSRPMGWSVEGAGKMAQLRAYYMNGGDMLELARYQKGGLPVAAGAEEEVLSAAEVLRSERNRHGELGKYVESITHSLSPQSKKKVYFNAHIWGL